MRITFIASLCASAALLVGPAAHARDARATVEHSQIGQYRSDAVLRASRQSAARGGGPAEAGVADPYVHERFSRDLADGCEYRADVRGAIRPAGTSERASVNADVTVRADLHCPNVSSVRAPARRIALQTVSASTLAQRISGGGVVRASRDGRACTYEPAFAFRDGVLVNDDVAVNCGSR